MFDPRHGKTQYGASVRRGFAAVAGVLALGAGSLASAAWVGMMSDNGGDSIRVFDGDTDTISEQFAGAPGLAQGDCAISSNQRLGITTNSSSQLSFIDLQAPTGTAEYGARHLEISNLGVDMAISPDNRFLVSAGGGALHQPLSVVDLESRREVATAGLFADHSSVEFCDDGTLLVTTTHGTYFGSDQGSALFDATLAKDGRVSLLGHSVTAAAVPNNSVCAPGSRAGVVLDRAGGITSFTLPGLEIAEHRSLTTREAVSASFSADGLRLYVRTADSVEAFDFDPRTGEMTADWRRAVPMSSPYFGMDQIAAHPAADKLYVDGGDDLLILDALSGEERGAIAAGDATGVCFASVPFQVSPVAEPPGVSGTPVAPPP